MTFRYPPLPACLLVKTSDTFSRCVPLLLPLLPPVEVPLLSHPEGSALSPFVDKTRSFEKVMVSCLLTLTPAGIFPSMAVYFLFHLGAA